MRSAEAGICVVALLVLGLLGAVYASGGKDELNRFANCIFIKRCE